MWLHDGLVVDKVNELEVLLEGRRRQTSELFVNCVESLQSEFVEKSLSISENTVGVRFLHY